jgi:hypothetical protein
MHSKPAYKCSLYFALYTAGYLNAFNVCLQALSLLRSLYGWISERIQSLPTSALSLSLYFALYTTVYLNAFKACLQALSLSLLRSLYGWISEHIQRLPTSALYFALYTAVYLNAFIISPMRTICIANSLLF